MNEDTFDRERMGRWAPGAFDYDEPPSGMKPVIANPDWPGYLSRGNWTHAGPSPLAAYVHQHMPGWEDSRVGRFVIAEVPETQRLRRFPGWRDVGAGAREWDDGRGDPPDHTSPFVD